MRCFSMSNRTHRGKRSYESKEFRKARSYCFENSWYDPTFQERIFIGESADVVAAVNLSLGFETMPEHIPDVPQGLVLTDNRGRGVFQQFVKET